MPPPIIFLLNFLLNLLLNFLDTALEVYKTNIRLEDWVLNMAELNFQSKLVKIHVKSPNVTSESLLHFASNCIFDNPQKYKVQICTSEQHLGSFINFCEKWFDIYANAIDPRIFVNRYCFRKYRAAQ
jgi:hypothetical protein